MVGNHKRRIRRIGLSLLVASVLTGASLLLLQASVWARFAMMGANGCGNFDDALDLAEDGDTLAMMANFTRESNGTTVTKSVTIQGGWHRDDGCDTPNQTFDEMGDLIGAGFVYDPNTYSFLDNEGGPVIGIDHTGTLTIENMVFVNNGTVDKGGGFYGTLSNHARYLMRNVGISNAVASGAGAGFYLEVRNGSRVVISDSLLSSNQATQGGGGFEIRVFDNSHVTIDNTKVTTNTAGSKGGGGRIIVESGYITVTNSTFTGNDAPAGSALSIESTGYGQVYVWLNDNVFDGTHKPSRSQVSLSGGGLVVRGNNFPNVYLPVKLRAASHPLPTPVPVSTRTPTPTATRTPTITPTPTPHALITRIQVQGDAYAVSFETVGFVPQLPGVHLHFFFDTVKPEDAGLPGPGPWKIYGGVSPFTGYKVNERPVGANKMCVLVANANHSIRLNTGNCFSLP